MPVYYFRFYEELNDFLPREKQKIRFAHSVKHPASVKHLIESLGVPHTEVDLILANGVSVDFSHIPRDGEELAVYPMFESLDIAAITRLKDRPLRRTRFVVDAHLGKLARILRMMGFDTVFRKGLKDAELIEIVRTQRRAILTRDRDLLKHKTVTHGYFIRSSEPVRQAAEVVRRFDLGDSIRPLTRCLECNSLLVTVQKDSVLSLLPRGVAEQFDHYHKCPDCGRVYWQGSHVRGMLETIDQIKQEANPGTGL